ncbi:MAG: right-handed parallel beta-helix repeat-containing protein [Chloroflexota bacterium]|jgi:F-box protein 11
MRSPRRTAAWALAAALVTLTTAGASAQDGGDTITVGLDDSADYASIREAIAAADDGDTVLLSPGTYEEGFLIDKAITLAGDGPREAIVIAPAAGTEAMHEAPWGETIPVGVYVSEADATLAHLTLAVGGEYLGLLLEGGSPLIEDAHVEGNDLVMVSGEPTFRDSVIDAYFAVRGASPTVEDSEILGHASVDGPGRTVIRRSTLYGGTSASADATGAYEDNLFVGRSLAVDSGSDMLVTGNTVQDVEGNEAGILVVGDGTSAEILGNTIERAAIGISVESSEPASSIVGNTIRDVRVGIHVESDQETRVTDNDISDVRTFGILLQGGRPVVEGNRICGAGEAFELRAGTDPQLGTNEVCETGDE